MAISLQDALNNTDVAYSELSNITNTIVNTYTDGVNKLIKSTVENVDNMSNEDIRLLIVKLSLESFKLGDVKEKSGLKATVAESLRKEAYAKEYNKAEGAVAARDNTAIINTSYEIMVEAIYEAVGNMLKTKLDEVHRVISSLTTVLTTRLSEAKMLSNID